MKGNTAESTTPALPALPVTPDAAARLLERLGPAWWRSGDVAALETTCAAVPDDQLAQWPGVARWRALAALLREQGDALSCLELAHAAHLAQGDMAAAACDAHIALTTCLCDIGAMDRLEDWLARARAQGAAVHPADDLAGLWLRLGLLARTVLGAESLPEADAALQWLHDQLRPLNRRLSPDERLLAAQVLVDVHFARQQYEQFDHLATLVEEPAMFERAAPVVRGRWLHTVGFAHYQIGRHDRAEAAWQRAIALAEAHGLLHVGLMTSLAMLRLLLDCGRLDEAQRIEESVQPRWGAGRAVQLIELQQMRARLQLLRGEPAQALATLQEALALAGHGGLSAPEQASLLTDLAQAHIANDRAEEAAALLDQLVREHAGRDAQVYQCLGDLLLAWRTRDSDEDAARARLAEGLRRAQGLRYTRFFRLLPALAADICALALRWGVEPVFVAEVIRSRQLRAPSDADERWPWTLWLRMFGGFELQLRGQPLHRGGKQQLKPLELLRLLGCERSLSVPLRAAEDALWPEADGAAARKSLEMTVQRLRRLLEDDTLVQVGDGRVALDPERTSSDVSQRRALLARLEALAMQARAQDDGQARACTALVARINGLGGGALLPDAPAAPWLEAERQRCEREALRAATAAAAVLERAGINAAERALVAGALREFSRR